MLFYPWRKEEIDLREMDGSYETCYKNNVEIILTNKMPFELDNGITNVIEETMDHFPCNPDHVVAAEIQHNEAIDAEEDDNACPEYACFNPDLAAVEYDLGLDLGISRKQVETNDISFNSMGNSEYNALVRSLNDKQKIFFYHVLHKIKTDDLPIYCFLTGGAGVGKSLLTTCLFQAITRFYSKKVAYNCDEVKAILCAPTGKAAYNIGGHTIHSTFCIPANQNLKYKPLDAQQLDNMRVKFRSLKVIFIDEVSMVGNRMFNFINLRLQDIFGKDCPFGGISIIAKGDLFQLKPVFDGWVFEDISEGYGPLAINLWTDLFQMYELTEIMRQKNDQDFAKLLNRLREGLHTDSDIDMLKSRICSRADILDMNFVPHLYTTNAQVNSHNDAAFEMALPESKCIVLALDMVNGDVAGEIKERILQQIPNDPSKTMGLFKDLHLATEHPAEICINVDVEDGLTNGSPCIVKNLDFRVAGSKRCSIVWVLFEDPRIGHASRLKYRHLYNENIPSTWTPVLEVSKKFTLGRHKSCHVTRRQFPLRMACAKTIHKAQGSTVKQIVLDLGSRKQEHMHYVGLSRVRKLQDLFILNLNENKIAVSEQVVMEMNRLRLEASLWACLPMLENLNSDVKIIYHNTRSLHLHYRDLQTENNMLSADIIVLAESRLKSSDKNEDYHLPGFSIQRFDSNVNHNNERPFYGIVVYSKLPLKNLKNLCLCGIETVV